MSRLIVLIIFISSNTVYSLFTEDCRLLDPESFTNACDFGGIELISSSSNTSIINKNNCNTFRQTNEFQTIPQFIAMPQAKCPGTYTIFMLDPDVPGYRPGRFYNHLTLSGIDCEDLRVGSMNSATTILRYTPPDPPINSGIHRYMFLIYRHEKVRTVTKKIANFQRSNWSLNNYLNGQKTVLCGPIGGLQFRIKSPDN